MKKVVMIFLSVILLVSCAKQTTITTEQTDLTEETFIDPTDNVTETTEKDTTEPSEEPTEPPTEATNSSETLTEPTEPTSAPTEPSEAPTDEVTEPSSDEATEPTEPDEPDPYADIKYYPFPLLDMTVAEIEAEYGALKWEYAMYGATPTVYSIPSLGIYLAFEINADKDDYKNIPEDMVASWLWYEYADVYPGLRIGMTPEQLPPDIEWLHPGLANEGEGIYGYYAFCNLDEAGCYIRVNFDIPDHILEEYPPVYGFTTEQLEALKEWSDGFIHDLYDTEIVGIRICRGRLAETFYE